MSIKRRKNVVLDFDAERRTTLATVSAYTTVHNEKFALLAIILHGRYA